MKKTYGELLKERATNEPIPVTESKDVADEMLKQSLHDLNAEIHDMSIGKFKDKDFYIAQYFFHERVGNTLCTKTFSTQACPMPRVAQSLYKYHHKDKKTSFMWMIPDKHLMRFILKNPTHYLQEGGNKELVQTCFDFIKGKLHHLSNQENGFKKDGLIIVGEEYG